VPAATPIPEHLASGRPKRPEKGIVHGILPDELPRLAPRLKPYLHRPDPAWPELVDAALRHDLGVSKSLWGEACLAMGRELAAVALAIVSTKVLLLLGGCSPDLDELLQHLAAIAQASAFFDLVDQGDRFVGQSEEHFLLARLRQTAPVGALSWANRLLSCRCLHGSSPGWQ
jgi:hypothetical protein